MASAVDLCTLQPILAQHSPNKHACGPTCTIWSPPFLAERTERASRNAEAAAHLVRQRLPNLGIGRCAGRGQQTFRPVQGA